MMNFFIVKVKNNLFDYHHMFSRLKPMSDMINSIQHNYYFELRVIKTWCFAITP